MVKKINPTKIKIKKRYLHKLVKHIEVISEKFILNVDKGGITADVMDESYVSTVDLSLSESCYSMFSGEEKRVGVKVEPLKQFLKTFRFDDILTIIIYEREEYDGKFIQVESTKDELFTISDSFRLVDIESVNSIKEISDKDWNWPLEIKISNECLRTICKHGMNIDDSLKIIYDDGEFEFLVEEHTNESRMKVQSMKKIKDTDKVIECLFDMKLLNGITNAIGKSSNIEVCLDNDYPMKIESEFEDGQGKVEYKLAPRIESS